MQQDEQKELHGWKEITAHLGLSRDMTIRRRYPVHKMPFSQGVYAFADALDAHTQSLSAKRIPIACKPRGQRHKE